MAIAAIAEGTCKVGIEMNPLFLSVVCSFEELELMKEVL
jgi:hypothetical protein